MHKLLSLVLSVSIVISSITPALGQSFLKNGAKVSKLKNVLEHRIAAETFSAGISRSLLLETFANSPLRANILKGQTEGAAEYILTRPSPERSLLLCKDFVTLSLMPNAVTRTQRLEAISFYQTQLKYTSIDLQIPYRDLDAFLEAGKESPHTPMIKKARQVLEEASALALVGSHEQAGVLLNFYKQAQGTLFEDTAVLITARGLLRMKAYNELGSLLEEQSKNPVLSGVKAYIQQHNLPVKGSTLLQEPIAATLNTDLASFLGANFSLNRLHADASLQATEQWMSLKYHPLPAPKQAASSTPATAAQAAKEPAVEPSDTQTENTLSQEQKDLLASDFRLVPLTPGGFVQPIQVISDAQAKVPAAIPAQPKEAPAAASQPASSTSGIVYGGVPVFAIMKFISSLTERIKNRFSKKSAQPAPYEEPGLHDSKVRPVYEVADAPEVAQIGGDLVGARADVEMVPVGADGFKLTVEDENKVEHILRNVDLTVSSSLKNFSAEYNRLALDNKYIFELRNQKIPAKRPDHFYFALSNTNGEIALLAQGAGQLNLVRPMRIKIQQTAAPKKIVTLPVYDINLNQTELIADVDASLLNGIKNDTDGQIVFHQSNLYFRNASGELTPLENSFIRLPKEESKHWTKILGMYPQTSFTLGVFSTMDKMPPVTYLVPSLQIGLGKTMSPVLDDMSTLGDTASSAIMLGINNVLPALMGFVHPFLKRYGEAAVFRVGASMFTAGGLIALASGLYGHVGSGLMSPWQMTGFLASSVLIALGTNITRFVQNIIISANRGIVPQSNSFKKKAKVEQSSPVTYNTAHLLKRAKEVLTKKSNESLRDVVYYQRGAMFKNLGTMLFLSFPWLANLVGSWLGVDLGLDFSASYVPYTLYSLYTLHKLSKIPYKDAFPLNLTLLKNNLQDAQSSAAVKISQIQPEMVDAQHPVMQNAAKQLKGTIDALVPVESRQTKKAANGLIAKYEAESGEEIEQLLLLANRTAEQAQQARQALQKAFDLLGHRNIKLKDVIRMAGLPTSLAAMTLATLGELGLSNGLAFAMRELIGNGTAATGIVGILLYGCMFGWRIFGNILSQRMSGGSMYALSSTASVAGPMMMAFSGGSVPLLVSGAIIACFGISNFFSQMYEYMVGLHPKYKREIALLINYTMPAGAIGASLLRLTSGVPGLDMGLAGLALAASVALTPGMLANSSILRTLQQEWRNLMDRIKALSHRGGDEPPLAQNAAN